MDAQHANRVDLIAAVERAETAGHLSDSAGKNLRAWLTEPRYAAYLPALADYIAAAKWQQLDDVFWTIIPFGTAGRRGKMYPIGSNAINDRTMGESAQGLADYVRGYLAEQGRGADVPACVIGYDTRHQSPHFAELCAGILVANGFRIHFFDGYRATPELSFAVRALGADCGIMITASHNPPSDNAIKMFWRTGGQLKPPHDEGVIERVYQADAIPCVPFSDTVASGDVQFCQAEMDPAYQAAVLQTGFAGPRDLKILYSPLHGVGLTSVLPVLQQDGFRQVEVFAPHAEPSGDFPNVPGNIANPENPAVFDALIAHARQVGAGAALATDPDADRLGVAAPLTAAADSPWQTLSGNQIGVLLAEYVLRHRQQAGTLSPEHYVIKTIVTTNMLAQQAAAYGIRCLGDVLTGFKWIGGLIEDEGPNKFVFGFEEAHGYLAGTHCRDKDGAVAALLMAQLAAECRAQGRTLHEESQSLYDKYGHYREKQISLTLPGSQGMAEMQQMMRRLRTSPPRKLAGCNVVHVRDYATRTDGPQSDVLIFETDQPDFYAAIRPSGTEPKLKFYLFGRDVADEKLDTLYRDLLAAGGD